MLDLQNNRSPIRTEPAFPAVSVAIEHGKQSSEGEAGLMLEKVAEWYIPSWQCSPETNAHMRKNGGKLIYWIN